jgi:glycosyltransferase involved in cell wall biosynthesis
MHIKEKIKLLQIVEDLKVGGLERVIASIASGLNEDDFETEIWCLANGGSIADELIVKGFKVKVLGLTSYHQPANIFRLARMMRQERFHIIHTHGYFASTFGRLAAIIGGIPLIFTHVHSAYYEYSKRHHLTEKILSKFTEKIICVSKAVQDFVVNIEGISNRKTCIIYNGSDISSVAVTYEADDDMEVISNLDGNNVVIIIVASLTENKGHRFLLEAVKLLIENEKKVQVLIVGDGPLRVDLGEYAQALGVTSRVIFTGQRNNVVPLLKVSDIFVLPSIRREGLSIAVIEAMAADLPVVGTSVGGLPEQIEDQINGFVVKPCDSYELYCALKRLVDEKSLRKQMGLQGRKIYEERFTPSIMNRQIEELYAQALERRCR